MPKEIKSYEVFDYLKKGREVRWIDYKHDAIINITLLSVKQIQELIDYAVEQNDFMTHFYIMEIENEE